MRLASLLSQPRLYSCKPSRPEGRGLYEINLLIIENCVPYAAVGMKMTMTEDEILSRIKMGVNVDIKRSDGRVHSAVVSGINIDTRSVTVEWFERGETKGKEVELETLLSLNQDLAPVNENGNNKIGKVSVISRAKFLFMMIKINNTNAVKY